MSAAARHDRAARIVVPSLLGDLWIGSTESGRPDSCQVVVTVADEPAPLAHAGIAEHQWVFPDSRWRPVPREQVEAALQSTLDGLAEGDVLVRCHRGTNRSALVAALVLRSVGVTSDEAIGAVRTARSTKVLSNPYFADLVRMWPHDPMVDGHG